MARELEVEPDRGLSAEEARVTAGVVRAQPAGRRQEGVGAGAPSCASTRTSCRSCCWPRRSSTRSSPGTSGTTVVLAGLTVFNAVIGLRQESKAEESVKALAQMMKTIARVRRDGQAIEIDAEELVPGDVVLVEAGNRVPADGRVCRGRDARDRGGGADRREPAGRQVDRAGARATTSRSATGPAWPT